MGLLFDFCHVHNQTASKHTQCESKSVFIRNVTVKKQISGMLYNWEAVYLQYDEK